MLLIYNALSFGGVLFSFLVKKRETGESEREVAAVVNLPGYGQLYRGAKSLVVYLWADS